jgi:activator of 2-hydroxyglutaryl-CoA dehydratase
LISKGEERENIIAGIHESIAARVVAMAGRTGLKAPIMMTGGVAKNIGVVKALEKKLGQPIEVSPQSQVTGAIGAALLAQRA